MRVYGNVREREWYRMCVRENDIVYNYIPCATGWSRLKGCFKLLVIRGKRPTKYRTLLRKLTYKDKASYDSTPPCRANAWISKDCVCPYTNTHAHTHTQRHRKEVSKVYLNTRPLSDKAGSRSSTLRSPIQVCFGVPFKCVKESRSSVLPLSDKAGDVKDLNRTPERGIFSSQPYLHHCLWKMRVHHLCVWWVFALTHLRAPWLIHVCHDSFMCAMSHSCVTWLIHVCHDSFMCAMSHSRHTPTNTHKGKRRRGIRCNPNTRPLEDKAGNLNGTWDVSCNQLYLRSCLSNLQIYSETHLLNASFSCAICAMTQSYVPWLIHVCHDSFRDTLAECPILVCHKVIWHIWPHSCVSWLICVCHGSVTVPWLIHVCNDWYIYIFTYRYSYIYKYIYMLYWCYFYCLIWNSLGA